MIQLHNWTFFMIFIRKIVGKSWAFFHLTFFSQEKKYFFFQFSFFNTKIIFSQILCTTFFPVKKDLFFTVLKLSTMIQAFIEKIMKSSNEVEL